MKEFIVHRDNEALLAFTGELIANSSSSSDPDSRMFFTLDMFLTDTPVIVASSWRVSPLFCSGKFALTDSGFLICFSFAFAAINGYSVTLLQQAQVLQSQLPSLLAGRFSLYRSRIFLRLFLRFLCL
ncbi:MAG: hypothetical protein H0X02_10530 [Nitrosomonas sp.]|nr:hypothetical protein [Nitrosomonas sp.]